MAYGPPVSVSTSVEAVPRRWWSLLGLCLVTALVWFAASDISIALPTIGRELGGTMDVLQWAVNGYFLAGAFIIVGGRIGDIYGRRLTFAVGTVLLVIGSTVAGLSPSPTVLIIGRVIEGLGAAAVLPTALSIIAVIFTGRQRDTAVAVWIAVCWGAQAIGPLIGGLVVDSIGWRWLFWLNLPIAAGALVLTWWATPETRDLETERRIDWPGVLTLVGGIFVLSYALVASDDVGIPLFIGMLALSVLLLVAFVFIERRSKAPIVVLSIFRQPRFDGAVLSNLIANFVFGGVIFFMSLYLQVVEGYDALMSGLLLLPATIPILLINPIGTWLGARFGPRWPTAAGMAMLAVAAFLLTDLSDAYSSAILPFILIGIGIGLQITPCAVTAVEDPGEAGEGVASGIFKASSMIGGSLGVAVGSMVFQTDARSLIEPIISGSAPADAARKVLDALTGGMSVSDVSGFISGDAQQVINGIFEQAVGLAMWPSIIASLLGVAVALLLFRSRAKTPS